MDKKDNNTETRWDNIYRQTPLTQVPWEEGKPSAELVTLIESGEIRKGPALDICCGSANNAMYLAKQGFTCYGIDISPTAIKLAREKISKEGVTCELTPGNAANLPYPENFFVLVFDRGCFHSQSPEDRELYVSGVHRVLKPAGKYLLLCFSTRDHQRDEGPPYSFSSGDIARYFSTLFKIHRTREFSGQDSGGRKHYFISVLMEKVR